MGQTSFGWLIAGGLVLAAGCGGGGGEVEYPSADEPLPVETKAEDKRPAPGKLWRQEVVAAVDAGLGRFLQKVEVEPAFDSSGGFQGFRVMALRPSEWWSGIDLQPGDVILRVNGKSIERETHAYDAFQGLKSADKLRVTFLRDGARKSLAYEIVDRPGSKKSKPERSAKTGSPDAG